MRWFWKYIGRKIKINDEEMCAVSDSHDYVVHSELGANSIRFDIYRANGGSVVEVRPNDRYGNSLKSFEPNLHIINDDEDFGESLSKILMLEKLRH